MPAREEFDTAVVGGGPAGTAAAISAARGGARVLLLERGTLPRHKVCGEFVSAEGLAALRNLIGAGFPGAPQIARAIAFAGERELRARIVPAAASISRFELDEALWRGAKAHGADCREHCELKAVTLEKDGFVLRTGDREFRARFVINAAGRWSKLQPKKLGTKSKWIGLKAHFRDLKEAHDDQPAVELYFLKFGYCGVQPVISEGEWRWNVCAMLLATAPRDWDAILAAHPKLAKRSQSWRQAIDTLAVAPLAFRSPAPTDQHGALAVGDAAAFIDPFVGDGIAIGLRSGAMAGELCASASSREEATGKYREWYAVIVVPALRNAARLRRMLELPRGIQAPLIDLANLFGAGEWLVRATRSKPAKN
jgi:flavin-dependent dehydrogenase